MEQETLHNKIFNLHHDSLMKKLLKEGQQQHNKAFPQFILHLQLTKIKKTAFQQTKIKSTVNLLLVQKTHKWIIKYLGQQRHQDKQINKKVK